MNIVDSSGWLEYLAAGPNAGFFTEPIEDTKELLVPSISIYEVFKRVVQQKSENEALQVIALMHQGQVVNLDPSIAISAARVSIQHQMPMADAIMLATARNNKAILWTQDSHFEGIQNVNYTKTVPSAK
jgi:predicted nucleic acid-binding protein